MTDQRDPTSPDATAPTEPADAQTTEPADAQTSADAAPSGTADAAATEQPDWEALASDDPRSRAELLAELTEAEARRDEYLEDVRRARAEFENYRKRMMREGSAQRAAGVADLMARLLDVLDDFDRTLEAASQSEDDGLRRGVELVHEKLVEVLRAAGLRRIDAAGTPFDPTKHEAVQQVPASEAVDEPVVREVLRPGYELADRVLRAAMVVVEQ